MLTASELHSLKAVLQAQRHLLEQVKGRLDILAPLLSEANEQADQLRMLSELMDEIEQESGFLFAADMADWDPEKIEIIYQRRRESVARETSAMAFVDWDQFVRDSLAYCARHDLDGSLPWKAFLSKDDLERLKQEEYGAQYRWDKWDYLFVGTAGVLASLTDLLLVKIPRSFNTGQYAGQQASPITEWLKKYDTRKQGGRQDWFAEWARNLESKCNVPYDGISFERAGQLEELKGAGGPTHRFQTLGHDPILGFIFGVRDIMRGTITGFSYDKSYGVHELIQEQPWGNLEPIGLITAILRQMGHLISDVATPPGIPPPFFTLFQSINTGNLGEKERTIGELARWMYTNGYDLRHFLVSGIMPAVIEIVLRCYLMIRHYAENGEVPFLLSKNPKYRSMLLSAHAIACAGNAGKVALYQRNPLAINYAEWLALIRYLLPSLKYWLFDRARLQLEHMNKITDAGWIELAAAADGILKRSYAETIEVVSLGR